MKTHLNKFALVAALLFLAINFGCKQSNKNSPTAEMAEQKIKEETGKDVDIKQKGMDVTLEMGGEEIAIKEGGDTWPAEIPAEVPKLENLKIKKVMRSDSPEMDAWSIIYEGTSVDRLDAYDAALKAAGFKTTRIKSPQGGQTTGEKGNLAVSCTISPDASMLSVQKQKNAKEK